MSKNVFFQIENLLQKIYRLERFKGQCLTFCNFSRYKKSCRLQEKIILIIKEKSYRKEESKKNINLKKLSMKIQRQMEINQILLDDIKSISQNFFEPISQAYYDKDGNRKKISKVFTVNI